jgi:hypothetical protein
MVRHFWPSPSAQRLIPSWATSASSFEAITVPLPPRRREQIVSESCVRLRLVRPVSRIGRVGLRPKTIVCVRRECVCVRRNSVVFRCSGVTDAADATFPPFSKSQLPGPLAVVLPPQLKFPADLAGWGQARFSEPDSDLAFSGHPFGFRALLSARPATL